MKRKLLFISGLMLIKASLFAQPNFTSSYHPVPGSIGYVQVAYTNGISFGTSGANLTWDYSSLQDSGSVQSGTYIEPSATKYAGVFPSANLADGVSKYLFLTYNSNVYEIDGIAGPNPGDTMYYTQPEILFKYPFTYQTNYVTTFAAHSTLTSGGDVEIDMRTGIDSFNAAGYGTLKLPNGHTFTNVLRVVLIENYIDDYTLDGYPFDTITERTYTVDYFSLDNTTQQLLSITNLSETEDGFTLSGISASFYPYAPSGINNVNPLVENLNVFPNPSYSQTTLSLSLKESSLINVYVTNILGQKVKSIDIGQANEGYNTYTIETGDMVKGIYLVTVEVNGSIAGIRKLEIE